ncbi:MAG: hypothetical protein B6D61_09335, partial [Bacteroidetes bacterium 4484_249]
SGIWGMTSGDGNKDSEITMQDKTGVWNVQAGNKGYIEGDYNLDVQVSNPDKNEKLLPNEGDTSYVADGFYCADSITDVRDGQKYKIVNIGSQCWMAQNLNIGIMINGDNNQIDNNTIEKYCYDNDGENCDTYGGLYQWDEMMQYVSAEGTQGICPDGWYLPTDEEWKMLEGAVDSQYDYPNPIWDYYNLWRGYDAGSNIKSTSGWSYGGNGSDQYGFNALPGGRHSSFFQYLTTNSSFWSSSENINHSWDRELSYGNEGVRRRTGVQNYGFSVRCLKN